MFADAIEATDTDTTPIILEGYDGLRPTRFMIDHADLTRPATSPNAYGKLAGVQIGRADDNDVSLSSHIVSRHHAVLMRWLDHTVIIDLGSANGTYVSGRRVSPGLPVEVNPGQEISFGLGATMTLRR